MLLSLIMVLFVLNVVGFFCRIIFGTVWAIFKIAFYLFIPALVLLILVRGIFGSLWVPLLLVAVYMMARRDSAS